MSKQKGLCQPTGVGKPAQSIPCEQKQKPKQKSSPLEKENECLREEKQCRASESKKKERITKDVRYQERTEMTLDRV